MVSIVENWALVEGRVQQWERPRLSDPGVLTLTVERVLPVEREDGSSFPNFLEGRQGSAIRVTIPAGGAQNLDITPGAAVKLRVRRGSDPNHLFAHPEQIEVEQR